VVYPTAEHYLLTVQHSSGPVEAPISTEQDEIVQKAKTKTLFRFHFKTKALVHLPPCLRSVCAVLTVSRFVLASRVLVCDLFFAVLFLSLALFGPLR